MSQESTPRSARGGHSHRRPTVASEKTGAGRGAGTHSVLPGAALVQPQELHLLGIETSEAERRAADAERELMDWKKASFMAGRLGEDFDALIISLTKHGFFVELVDLFVEGMVPVDSFDDDRYIYRERERAIVGERSKRAYRLGERVRVRLDRIDQVGNKLQFSVAE